MLIEKKSYETFDTHKKGSTQRGNVDPITNRKKKKERKKKEKEKKLKKEEEKKKTDLNTHPKKIGKGKKEAGKVEEKQEERKKERTIVSCPVKKRRKKHRK